MAASIPSLPPEPEGAAKSLLPVALQGGLATLLLWLLPILILLALNVQGYGLVEGNMSELERANAHLLGWAGFANALLALVQLVVVARLGPTREPSFWWGLPTVLVQVAYLWLAVSISEDLLPRSVVSWIYPEERFFYNQFAFAMLPLFWGLVRLACAPFRRDRRGTIMASVGAVIAGPILLYGLFQVVFATGALRVFAIVPVLIAIMVILVGLTLFVGLIRGLMAWFGHRGTLAPSRDRGAIGLFALVMPLGGMLLNRGIPFPVDLQAWEVYALVVINAAILLLASWQHAQRPRLSLVLLSATLPFSLYFFVIFLPFLPLAPLAVIAVGAGSLILTPTVLLVLHLNLLNRSRVGQGVRGFMLAMLGFLVLPGFFTGRGLADKAALNAALDYLYTPTITSEPITYSASPINLRRALDNHRSYKNGIYYPLLSEYYAWLVFDHLVLPDDKLDQLEQTFFGATGSRQRADLMRGNFERSSVRDRNRMPRAAPPPRTVVVSDLALSTHEQAGGARRVTMVITLQNTGSAAAEYAQILPLPEGVFVSGFRLHIEGQPVPGRITEKKTALWVYSMIRDSERRDPGLLFYNTPDELELRVFPVAVSNPSVVEIDFLVPPGWQAPANLTGGLDPARAMRRLGAGVAPWRVHDARGGVMAGGLSSLALPAAPRRNVVHLIVDRSAETGFRGDLRAATAALAQAFPEAPLVRVTLANYDMLDLDLRGDWSLDSLPLRGGFAVDLAIARALRQHRDYDLDGHRIDGIPARPTLVLLSETVATPAAVPELKRSDAWREVVGVVGIERMDPTGRIWTLQAAYPENGPMLRLGESVRPWREGRATRFDGGTTEKPLEVWNPAQGAWQALVGVDTADAASAWKSAAALQMQHDDYARKSGEAHTDLSSIVAASQASGVMTGATSYIVVENAAQWRMLDVSERKKLDQNEALAFRETPAPPLLWLVLGFSGWMVLRRRRSMARQSV